MSATGPYGETKAVRAESEEIRARLAQYIQAIQAYDNQYTPPPRNTTTQEINSRKRPY